MLLLPGLLLALAWTNAQVLLRPEQIESRIHEILEDKLAVGYKFGRAEFGLLSGLVIEDLAIANPPEAVSPTAIEIEEIQIGFRLLDLLRGQVTLDEIRVRKPHVHLERLASGNLNLMEQLRADDSETQPLTNLPTVFIEDMEVTVCGESLAPLQEPLKLPHLSLALPSDKPGEYSIDGLGLLSAIRHVKISGSGNIETGDFAGSIEIVRLHLHDDLRERLPAAYREIWARLQPEGLANVELRVKFEEHELTHSEALFEIVRGKMKLEEYGLDFDALQGTLRATPERLETMGPLRGLVGHGEASLEGYVTLRDGTIADSDVRVSLSEISVGAQAEGLLTGEFLDAWRRVEPRGRVGLNVHMKREGSDRPRVQSELILRGVDVRLPESPYWVEGLRGSVFFDGEKIEIERDQALVGSLGSASARIWGMLPIPVEGTLDLRVELDEFPINRNLHDALPPAVQKHWRLYGVNGLVDVEAWVHGEVADPQIGIVAHMRDTSMRYELFPYVLEGITGSVRYERRPAEHPEHRNLITFERVGGNHGESLVGLRTGIVSWEGDSWHLDLAIQSDRVRIEEDLLAALPDAARDVVRSFNLEGHVGVLVEIFKRDPKTIPAEAVGAAANKVEVRTTVDARRGTRFRYDPLPYPFTLAKGQAVHTLSTGTLLLNEMETDPESGPRLLLDGAYGTDSKDPRKQVLDLHRVELLAWRDGPGMPIDEQLRTALPKEFREFIEGLNLRGHVSGRMSVSYHFLADAPEGERQETVRYDGDLTGHRMSVDFGVGFEQIDAKLSVLGHATPEKPHSFFGTATVQQCRFSRFRVRNTEVSFGYGGRIRAVQDAIDGTFQPEKGGKFLFTPELRSRLSSYDVSRTLQVFVKQGDLYGGNVEGFIYVDSGGLGDFGVDLRADAVQLDQGSEDIFREEGVEGVGHGWVRFGGLIDNASAMSGMGQFRIRDGKLKKLPILVATIGAIANLKLGSVEGRYIEDVQANFHIRDRAFWIDEWADLVLSSPALKMRGIGYMDFDQNMELFLEPEIFTDWIPGVSQIVKSIKGVKLTGPLDNPVAQWPVLYQDMFRRQ